VSTPPSSSAEGRDASATLTVDQLAAAVGMTVRNVRAYASRGLIAAPRLVGRTGYYGRDHVNRLRLIRDLLERGYTLNAIEQALQRNDQIPDAHVLDLMTTLTNPLGEPEEPEDIEEQLLTHLAGVEHDPGFVETLIETGLLERVGPTTLRMHRPVLVRAGAQALALGIERDSVLQLWARISEHLHEVAETVVRTYREEVWHPFAEAGMPEDKWPAMLSSVESILPVVAQAVLALFRDELADVVEEAMGEEIAALGGLLSGAAGDDARATGTDPEPHPDSAATDG